MVDQVERQRILVELHLLLNDAECIGHHRPGEEVPIPLTDEGIQQRKAIQSLRWECGLGSFPTRF